MPKNIIRDPRWGRSQETPGEDPYLTSQYAIAFIQGLQKGEDERYLKTIACAKHYTAYDLENWKGIDRKAFDAKVTKRDMEETFQYPFYVSVKETKVASIMCSYNSINGIPACCHQYLQNEVLRNKWGWEGFIVSDNGAIKAIFDLHKYIVDPVQATIESLFNGCDLNLGDMYNTFLPIALDQKLIKEEDLNLPLYRVMYQRMKLGDFDPWDDQVYRKIPKSVVSSQKHQDLALTMAQKSMILLKNEKTLPLDSKDDKQICLFGPLLDAEDSLLGNYAGPPPFIISPLQGVKKYSPNVKYEKGCESTVSTSKKHFEKAKELAKTCDISLLFVGFDHNWEGEGKDKKHLEFPGVQSDLIKLVKEHTKEKTIVVFVGGSMVDLSWEKDNVGAIVVAGYPGQSGGAAIADVLFGKVSPSGRLPYTIYPAEYASEVNFFDMAYRPSENSTGRGYRFYTKSPIYPFGYGLTYSSFNLSWGSSERVRKVKRVDIPFKEEVIVTNTGEFLTDYVLLCFISNTFKKEAPIKTLFSFKRLRDMKPGEKRTVFIDVEKYAFEYVDEDGNREVLSGDYSIQVDNLRKNVHVT